MDKEKLPEGFINTLKELAEEFGDSGDSVAVAEFVRYCEEYGEEFVDPEKDK